MKNINTDYIFSKIGLAFSGNFFTYAKIGLAFIFASWLNISLAETQTAKSLEDAKHKLSNTANTELTIKRQWNELIKQTNAYALKRQAENAAREAVLQNRKNTYSKALALEKIRLQKAKNQSLKLEAEQKDLEQSIDKLQQQIDINAGFLGEVFSVFEAETKQFSSNFEDSFLSVDRPEIAQNINYIANFSGIVRSESFTKVWQILQKAILASGELRKFNAAIVNKDGQVVQTQALRLGDFGLVGSQGPLMKNDGVTLMPYKQLNAATKRAGAKYFTGATQIAQIDPSRGLTYILLERQPNLLQRINQGGVIGYIILLLLFIGLCVAFWRSYILWRADKAIQKQLQNKAQLSEDNILGAVLLQMPDSANDEVLETALDEAILRQTNNIGTGLGFLKLLAAVAPLMGLLGTVSGMISTFQAISVFGSGDPSLMADGISQALVTTVLGLITAVPILFAHLLLQTKANNLNKILEAETTAWLLGKLKQLREP